MAKMVKVIMLTTAAGPAGVFPAGSPAEVEQALAEAWVAGGFARYADAPAAPAAAATPPAESAEVAAPEQAVGARERTVASKGRKGL